MITEISVGSSVALTKVSSSTIAASSPASEDVSELEQPTEPSKRHVAMIDLVKIERLVMNQKRSQDQAQSTLADR